MENWVEETLGLTLAEFGALVGLAGFGLAFLMATIPPLRRLFQRVLDIVLVVSGSTRRRYLRWFRKEHQKVKNIYLDREEVLDLSTTYVPLTVSGGGLDGRTSARAVLANPERDRVIVVGEPGSGKSTLLKAFGTALASRQFRSGHTDFRTFGRPKEVPILVHLRRFSAAMREQSALTLREYITDEIFGRGAKLKRGPAFLDRLLRKRRCLLMLDGLDEVPGELYPLVRGGILEFLAETAHDDGDPGALRVVLTCRSQNFLGFAGDWIPRFSPTRFTLTPLRDDEVLELLRRREGYQKSRGQSPDAFYADVQGSGMMGLHRVPLILTISLGLYLKLAVYRIPRSRPAFYAEMIKELLRRRDFPTDLHAGVERNQFSWEEKERFLRQLALAMAERPNRFDEFTYQEIYAHADSLAGKVAHLSPGQARDFVKEIIDSSGLLSRVASARETDEDVYIFAHRSVHEYLAAVQLARRSAAAAKTLLLERTRDPLWHQITLLYTALGPEEQLPELLERLMAENLELAGHCLAEATQVPSGVAPMVISGLADAVRSSTDEKCLAALVACCGSRVADVGDYAFATLTEVLLHTRRAGDEAGLPHLLKLEDAQLIALVDQLASVASEDALRLVSQICIHVDDQLQLVRPLWRCLASSMERSDETRVLVQHLLGLVGTPEGRRALDEQPTYSPSFATEESRRQAYPFDRGHDRSSNFVTLLTWASWLGIGPHDLEVAGVPVPDRLDDLKATESALAYFEAKTTHPEAFARLEADRQRRFTVIRPYWFGAALFLTGYIGAAIVVGRTAIAGGLSGLYEEQWLLQVALVTVASLSSGLIAGLIAEIGPPLLRFFTYEAPEDREPGGDDSDSLPQPFSPFSVFIMFSLGVNLKSDERYPGYRGVGKLMWNSSALGLWAWTTAAASPIAYTATRLFGPNAISFLIGIPACLFFFWLPTLKVFARDTKLYIRSPNPFLHLYDDPATAHWLVLDTPD